MINLILLTAAYIKGGRSLSLCNPELIRDGRNLTWLNHCDPFGRPQLFYKDYSNDWTYIVDTAQGSAEFSYRVPYAAVPCQQNPLEIDSFGNIWSNWCLPTGDPILFAKSSDEYITDHLIGESLFNYRLPLRPAEAKIQSFLQLESEELGCAELEGDNSGRFFEVEYIEGKKVEHEKDGVGNFILDSRRRLNSGKPVCVSTQVFELDPSGDFYWVLEFNKGLPIIFEPSVEHYYYIDPLTGTRKLIN